MKPGLLWSDSFSFILLTQGGKKLQPFIPAGTANLYKWNRELGSILVYIIDGGAVSTLPWDHSLLYVHL